MQPAAELRLPAETAYVAVLRMTTAGIAARLDFTLDAIEDLRIAVGEACALVLEGADPSGDLRATYQLADDQLTVEIAADTIGPLEPDRDSFAWQVLTALCTRLDAESSDAHHAVSLTVPRVAD
ncbi:MAG TPA: ATP-binding protein [Marmoricola sp.]|jgi:serine/threonine-protein kinase RsbW|nr:ATP-binding protein [Marmoricola sp.]